MLGLLQTRQTFCFALARLSAFLNVGVMPAKAGISFSENLEHFKSACLLRGWCFFIYIFLYI